MTADRTYINLHACMYIARISEIISTHNEKFEQKLEIISTNQDEIQLS